MRRISEKVFTIVVFLLYSWVYFWVLLSYINRCVFEKNGSLFPFLFFLFITFLFLFFRINRITKETSLPHWVTPLYAIIVSFLAYCIEEIAWNGKINRSKFQFIILDIWIFLVFLVILLLVTQNITFSTVVILNVAFIWGSVNHYTRIYRGCPPLFGDFFAIKTVNVIFASYDYYLSNNQIISLSLLIIGILLSLYFVPQKKKDHNRCLAFITRLIIASGLFVGLINLNIEDIFHMKQFGWQPISSFNDYGAPASVLLSARNLRVTKPKGYDVKVVKEILNAYPNEGIVDEDNPIILLIMNESFSELKVLGDFISDEYLDNWNNMDSYVMKGYAYSSIYGAGTPNSEFEVLTGASMFNMRSGVFPYQNYDLKKSNSLAKILNSNGYNSVAFHSYYADTWNRISVYPKLGFSKYYSQADMEYRTKVSWCTSDESDYNTVKTIVSQNSTDPLFLFNVTMQNHGSYDKQIRSDIELVSVEEQYQDYHDLIVYLTLMRESDSAFRDLVEYVSNSKRKILLCLFGDHQPALDNALVEKLIDYEGSNEIEKEEIIYKVPYIILTNYDVESDEKYKNIDLSLNYLGAHILRIVGIKDPYFEYLLDLENEIPIINSIGYMTSDGKWHRPDEENDCIRTYSYVQYYELFGDK